MRWQEEMKQDLKEFRKKWKEKIEPSQKWRQIYESKAREKSINLKYDSFGI